jgi:hypothetical protein
MEEIKMPNITNSHAQRLYDSLLKSIDKQSAEDFACNYPLSKSATFERKFKWAEDVCIPLESKYDDKTIINIRMGCACGPSDGTMKKMKQLYMVRW